MNIKKRLKNISSRQKMVIVFLFSLLFFGILQFSFPDFLGHDAYYHVKVAEMMKNQGLIIDSFPWLQYTILNENYVDHHFLFHIFLLPFTLLPLAWGGKIASVVSASLIASALFWYLQKNKVKLPLLWTIIFLISSSSFLFRITLVRAQSLSLVFFIIGLYLIQKKKYWLLSLTSFVYVWLFDGFILLGALVAIWCLCAVIKNCRLKSWRESFWLILSYLGGTLAGIVINPYFPDNIYFLYVHLIKIALFNPFAQIPVGGEWAAADSQYLLKNSTLIVLCFILSLAYIIITSIHKKKKPLLIYFLALSATLFLTLTVVAKRMIEYAAPLTIILVAVVISHGWRHYQPQIARLLANRTKLKAVIITILIASLTGLGISNYHSALTGAVNYRQNHDYNYKEVSQWLADNTPAQSIIFHPDWGDFPMLFFYNTHNYYTNGMDIKFMVEYDQNLFNKWNRIFHKEELEKTYSVVKYDFKADYMLVTDKFKPIQEHLESDPRFEKVFEAERSRIYKLK